MLGGDLGLFFYTAFMGAGIDIYLFLSYFHKHIISVIAMFAFAIKLYYLWVWLVIRLMHVEYVGFLQVFMMIGGGLTFISLICRLSFRYWVYRPVFEEHRRLYSEFFDFWYSSVFTRSHLGSTPDEEDDWFAGSILGLLNHIECIWDYVMVAVANSLTFVGFILSSILAAIVYTAMNIMFFVASCGLLLLFVSYPGLLVVELLLALCLHHSSESGEFRFVILRFYFIQLDAYMRFVFSIEMNFMNWIELREEYIHLCQTVFFLLAYGFLGSWAFLLLEDIPSTQPGQEVRLSQEALVVVAVETTLTSLGGVFVSIAAGVATGSLPAQILFVLSISSFTAQLVVLWRNSKRKDMLVTMASNPKNYIVTSGGLEGWPSDEESCGGQGDDPVEGHA